MSPQDLKSVLQAGLLSFPLTDFDSELRFAPKPYADRLEWLQPYGASALFAAGGTGEFFSLEPGEYSEVIKVALATCKNRTPIIAGAGAVEDAGDPAPGHRAVDGRAPASAPRFSASPPSAACRPAGRTEA